MTARLLVAGGGIAGLASALALAQRGHRVQVLEQAHSFSEIGAGVQLGPNVTRRLAALGVGLALRAAAAQPHELVVRSARNGARLAYMTLGSEMNLRYGAPYLCMHRADLHAVLRAAAQASGVVELNIAARVSAIQTNGDLVVASSDDARTWQGDGLIGADGLWSTVRGNVVIGGGPPHATGHTAWRALVPQADLPAALRRNRVEVWLGPRLHAVCYPVRGGDVLNLVLLAESPAAAQTGDARGWDQPATLAALEQATGGMGSALLTLLEAMPAWGGWSLHDRAPLTSAAQLARGRVALVGDAAHPMLPYMAQGAGMAIEDAVALAEALQAGGPPDLPRALAHYAAARWQRNARVQARARRQGEIFHATGMMRLGRDAALRSLGARLLHSSWLWGG